MVLLVLLLVACKGPPPPAAVEAMPTAEIGARIVIAHTNDLHTHFRPSPAGWTEDRRPVGGVLALSAQVEFLRARWGDDHVLLLDSGDLRSGTPLDEYEADGVDGGAMLELLAAMDYDAWTVGNHEFDEGLATTLAFVEHSPVPVLSANLRGRDGGVVFPSLRPSTTFRVGDLTVGVVGAITPGTAKYVAADLTGLTVTDPVSAVKMEVERLGGVDVLVALTHLGLDDDRKLAEAVPQLDLIVGGHSHTRMERAERVGDTWIVQAGSYAQGIGVSVVQARGDGTIDLDYRLVNPAPDDRPAPPRAEVTSWYRAWDAKVKADWGVLLGHNAWGTLSRKGGGEHPLGRWVCESIRRAASADVGVYNDGGLRGDIEAGPVLREDLYTVLPFGNDLVVATVTGSDLLAIALRNASAYFDPSQGRLIQQQGLTYTWRERLGAPELVDVFVNGERLDTERTYTLATNAFVAREWVRYVGGAIPAFRPTGGSVRDALEVRVRAEGITVVPPAGGSKWSPSPVVPD